MGPHARIHPRGTAAVAEARSAWERGLVQRQLGSTMTLAVTKVYQVNRLVCEPILYLFLDATFST